MLGFWRRSYTVVVRRPQFASSYRVVRCGHVHRQMSGHRLYRPPDRHTEVGHLYGGPRGVARRPEPPAHDAFTRLLRRLEPDPETLWAEARPLVHKAGGVLVVDDSTFDKPYAEKIELVNRHWSGKHKVVVWGINLITLVWTDGDRLIPVNHRVYDKANVGLTMLAAAEEHGFNPLCVAFESWYSGLENLKAVRNLGWTFLTPLRANRKVEVARAGMRAVSEAAISESGTLAHLPGFGTIRIFKVVSRDEDVEYWATNDLVMDALWRLPQGVLGDRDVSPGVGAMLRRGAGQVRSGVAQRNHIGLAIPAFLRLEHHLFTIGIQLL